MKNLKIAVLVSGGVDSSVALQLLHEQGYQIKAFYLKIWLEEELSFLGSCPWQEDLNYIEAICDKLKIPLEIIAFQKEYWEKVVSYTIAEVHSGRTPNPDILCNKRVKFGAFLERVSEKFDYVASGHYAHLENGFLQKSPDRIKDQTYFLAHLSTDQLKKILFPLGKLTKAEVRELANRFDLPNKDRKDSQGICFLGKIKFADFIKFHLGEKVGSLVEIDTGYIMGEHKGFWYYTIGQRQGIGLSGGPWYVVSKDTEKNIVYISKNYYKEELSRNSFIISNCNWITTFNLNELKNLHVKLRHGPAINNCSLEQIENGKYRVILEERDQGIAPGQFAVFYDNNICLGSGVIGESTAFTDLIK